jgi:hypothetical protein
VLKQEVVTAVGKQVVHVDFIAILAYLVMFYVKWHINVYYQVSQNLVGNKTYIDFY